ncbi:probable GTP-binding protein OBGC2 [Phoenix dactylifera]|uniref:Probable GTP-binding protein OBGC2 n=1 Tax=Phoenix dactylifera TaxID=42345 RepID=A0A8B9AH05_PHODC|nr:probable GTP-binding protein OBGC2 [Phoenix dactylifera]
MFSHFFSSPNPGFSKERIATVWVRGLGIRWGRQWSYSSKGIQYFVINCRSARVKESLSTNAATLIREPYHYFDQVVITVRSGDGGHGAVLSLPNLRNTTIFAMFYCFGWPKGKIILVCAKAASRLSLIVNTQYFHFTIVLNQLLFPYSLLYVSCPFFSQISLFEMPEHRRKRLMALSSNVMRDESDKVLVLGQPGEEVSLELILRVVADAGLVGYGLPNAGKSTLLAAITLAKPDIADYPLTTLMPSLGRLDGDPTLEAPKYSSGATLADLPGLIEGAHLGKGLGRNFLRHLRRTRLLVHVVDATAENPINDYRTVREWTFLQELRMYNPDYLQRPYMVVLNKIDLPEVHSSSMLQ